MIFLAASCLLVTYQAGNKMVDNYGVYTDTSHNLYIADAEPSADTVPAGLTLQPGEITAAIKSSGICG